MVAFYMQPNGAVPVFLPFLFLFRLSLFSLNVFFCLAVFIHNPSAATDPCPIDLIEPVEIRVHYNSVVGLFLHEPQQI